MPRRDFAKKPFVDLFPKDDLVRQHKPFILKETKRCSQKDYVPFSWMVPEAVRLANIAAQKYDPARGNGYRAYLDIEVGCNFAPSRFQTCWFSASA